MIAQLYLDQNRVVWGCGLKEKIVNFQILTALVI